VPVIINGMGLQLNGGRACKEFHEPRLAIT
ncbi:MAG: hypothetical protein RL106_1936, partial [Bacteroidota bacterium]